MNDTKPTDRFQNLLTALQRVNEDILSLGDDLLLSIRPPDKQSIETGYQALTSYNEVLAGFTTWFQSYQRLVGSEHVASLLAQRTRTRTARPFRNEHGLPLPRRTPAWRRFSLH